MIYNIGGNINIVTIFRLITICVPSSDPVTVKLGSLETKHYFIAYTRRRRDRRWHD